MIDSVLKYLRTVNYTHFPILYVVRLFYAPRQNDHIHIFSAILKTFEYEKPLRTAQCRIRFNLL